MSRCKRHWHSTFTPRRCIGIDIPCPSFTRSASASRLWSLAVATWYMQSFRISHCFPRFNTQDLNRLENQATSHGKIQEFRPVGQTSCSKPQVYMANIWWNQTCTMNIGTRFEAHQCNWDYTFGLCCMGSKDYCSLSNKEDVDSKDESQICSDMYLSTSQDNSLAQAGNLHLQEWYKQSLRTCYDLSKLRAFSRTSCKGHWHLRILQLQVEGSQFWFHCLNA